MTPKTTYTFMSLPGISKGAICRFEDDPPEGNLYAYPFDPFPLKCHISPSLAVINGGPKLLG